MKYIPPDLDRRQQDVPVSYERRIESRVAVLETRVDNQDSKLNDHHELLERFLVRLESNASADASNTINLNKTISTIDNTVNNLTVEIKRTNDSLVKFVDKVEITSEKVAQWDTIAKTLAKVAVVISALVGMTWTAVQIHNSYKTYVEPLETPDAPQMPQSKDTKDTKGTK